MFLWDIGYRVEGLSKKLRRIENSKELKSRSIWYCCFHGILVIVRFEEKDCRRN